MDRARNSKYMKSAGTTKRELFIQRVSSTSSGSRRSSLGPFSPQKKKQRARLDLKQAISEALEDYTREHLDEYSQYADELSPSTSTSDLSFFDEKEPLPAKEEKRRHSFDLQIVRSPIVPVSMKEVDVEPLTLDNQVEKVPEVVIIEEKPSRILLMSFLIV